jgi:hypothetical protein
MLAILSLTHKMGRLSGPTDDIDDLMQPNGMAIGGEHAVIEFVVAAFLKSIAAEFQDPVPIVRMNVIFPEVFIVEPGIQRESEDFLDLPRDEGGAEGERQRSTRWPELNRECAVGFLRLVCNWKCPCETRGRYLQKSVKV